MSNLDPGWAEVAQKVADRVLADLRDNPVLPTPWLTPRQAAAYLSMDERGLENWRRKNRGPRFARVSHKTLRYNIKDLDAWLEAHADPAPPEVES